MVGVGPRRASGVSGRKSLALRVEALAPRRLMALTGLFIFALAAIVAGKVTEEGNGRRIETELRVNEAANNCARALNLDLMTATAATAPIGADALKRCYPGGATALYLLAPTGEILFAFGSTQKIGLTPSDAARLTLAAVGETSIQLANVRAFAAWRPLDNGDVVLAAAPARDIFERPPVWITYGLMLAAVGLVCASLMAAFIRQSRSTALAAGAIDTLRETNKALSSGRVSPWRYNVETRSVSFSRSFLEPMGFGPRDRDFTLSEISALVHPNDLRTALATLTGATTGVSDGIVRLRSPMGGWARAYFRTAHGAGRRERTGVAMDMSGAANLSPAAALAQSRLKDAIESIPEAFVLWDGDGNLAAWNRRFTTIFRLAPTDLQVGMSASDVAAIAPAGGAVITDYFAPDAALDQQSVEVALPKERWMHISRRRTAEGGIVCVASNVTDLKRRAKAQLRKERELQALVGDLETSRRELSETMGKYEFERQRAEEASRSKSEFLANMSHELRTPLNAINGFTEIMQSELYGPLGDPKYKEYVDDILLSGRHLLELIEDILDMSKIEAGRLSLNPTKVELEKLLKECSRLVAKRAGDAGVKLNVSVAHAPAAFADARAVKQVALNLLSNAIKFTDEGGEVTLTVEADLDTVTIIVADSGIGIEKQHLDRLGAPFELVEDHISKSRRGSGLGLALSRSLMELQGGLLGIASQRQKGTVACAAFPRRRNAKVRMPQFVRNEAHILTGGAKRFPQEADVRQLPPQPGLEPVRATPEAAE